MSNKDNDLIHDNAGHIPEQKDEAPENKVSAKPTDDEAYVDPTGRDAVNDEDAITEPERAKTTGLESELGDGVSTSSNKRLRIKGPLYTVSLEEKRKQLAKIGLRPGQKVYRNWKKTSTDPEKEPVRYNSHSMSELSILQDQMKLWDSFYHVKSCQGRERMLDEQE